MEAATRQSASRPSSATPPAAAISRLEIMCFFITTRAETTWPSVLVRSRTTSTARTILPLVTMRLVLTTVVAPAAVTLRWAPLRAIASPQLVTLSVICIGANLFGANVGNSCYIGDIWTQPGGSQAVFVNADGKLGAQVSSRRFKDAIKPLGQASEALFALKPVSFRYKKEIDSTAASQFGLVAEDVEKVNRDLVVRNKEGKAYSVRYDQVNAMLLNEFLKEHKAFLEEQRKVQEQEGAIAQQPKGF